MPTRPSQKPTGMPHEPRPPRGAGKDWIIYPDSFLMSVGLGCLQLGIVFYARDRFGADPARTGLLAGIWGLSYCVSCLTLRPLVRRLLPRHSVFGAALTMALLIAAMLMAPAFWMLHPLYLLLGAAITFFWPPLMGWLSAHREGQVLNRATGIFNLCWSTGFIVSPVLAAPLSQANPAYPLIAAAVLLGAVSLHTAVGMILVPALDSDDAAHTRERDAHGGDSSGSPLRHPAWLGLFSSYFVLGILLNVFPMAARETYGFSKTLIGALLLLRALSTTLTFASLGRLTWWHHRGGQMIAGSLLSALLLMLFPLRLDPWWTGGVLVVSGIFLGQHYANSLFHGVSGSVQRARRMAIHEAALSAGLFCGAALGGRLYQDGGLVTLYGACAVLMLATALLQTALLRNATRPSQALP